jgi:hypothetical protein
MKITQCIAATVLVSAGVFAPGCAADGADPTDEAGVVGPGEAAEAVTNAQGDDAIDEGVSEESAEPLMSVGEFQCCAACYQGRWFGVGHPDYGHCRESAEGFCLSRGWPYRTAMWGYC